MTIDRSPADVSIVSHLLRYEGSGPLANACHGRANCIDTRISDTENRRAWADGIGRRCEPDAGDYSPPGLLPSPGRLYQSIRVRAICAVPDWYGGASRVNNQRGLIAPRHSGLHCHVFISGTCRAHHRRHARHRIGDRACTRCRGIFTRRQRCPCRSCRCGRVERTARDRRRSRVLPGRHQFT
jgi:hypothetical protein